MAARDTLYQIYLDDVNKKFAMSRQAAASGWGLEGKPYSEPYHAPSTTNVYLPPMPVEEKPAAPVKNSGGLLKTLAMAALLGTGGGGLVAAGGLGAYTLLKEQLNKPVQIDPASFKTKISFDPEKGLQVGELEPSKKQEKP